MTVQVSFDIECELPGNSGSTVGYDDWGHFLETRLRQEYDDMDIKLEKIKENTLSFLMEFKNRPTFEPDVRARIYEFMRYYPTIEIQSLKIQVIA